MQSRRARTIFFSTTLLAATLVGCGSNGGGLAGTDLSVGDASLTDHSGTDSTAGDAKTGDVKLPKPGPVLQPGTGFPGKTAQPAKVGSGAGSDRSAIAHWDMVPYQAASGAFNVGVLAYHFNDIDRVEFALNGGPWLAVSTASQNPQTGVEEYWVTFDPSLVPDGPVEIRAIAYPKAGVPTVLQGTPSDENSSLFLSANSKGTLSHEIRYAAKDGDDTRDCTSAAKACKTLGRAILSAKTGGAVDGAEIRLGAGSWELPELKDGWGPALTTEHRWLTITAAKGTTKDKVIITGVEGASDGAGLWIKLTRLYNLTLTGSVGKAAGASFEDYVWFDHADLRTASINTIADGDCFQFNGWGSGNPYTGAYYTDVYMTYTCDGPRDATLARNVFADETGGGHSSGTATVINYSVKTIYGSGYQFPTKKGPDYHGDVYQMYGRKENIIIYGAKNVAGGFISSRGIVGSSGEHKDVAIVKTELTFGGWVFSFCGNNARGDSIDHLVIKDSKFVGSSNWCGETPGSPQPDGDTIKNVLIDHSTFENGSAKKVPQPQDLPGIKYVPLL